MKKEIRIIEKEEVYYTLSETELKEIKEKSYNKGVKDYATFLARVHMDYPRKLNVKGNAEVLTVIRNTIYKDANLTCTRYFES